MTPNPTNTFGFYAAADLIEAKRQGTNFNKDALANRLDVLLASWMQTQGRSEDELLPACADPVEAIYQAYPRKVGKPQALKAIKAALKRMAKTHENAPQALLSLVNAYAATVAEWPEKDRGFIPHPTTFFNQDRYADDPKEWTARSWHNGSRTVSTTPRDYTRI